MFQRISDSVDSLDMVRCGWIASSVGGGASIAVSAAQLEVTLKLLVLVFTLLTLILTAILQIRALRKP